VHCSGPAPGTPSASSSLQAPASPGGITERVTSTKKMGLRIDAFLLSPPLAARLRSCGIDRSFRKGPKPSDHAPLLAELAE
jgi:hypothetical protein